MRQALDIPVNKLFVAATDVIEGLCFEGSVKLIIYQRTDAQADPISSCISQMERLKLIKLFEGRINTN